MKATDTGAGGWYGDYDEDDDEYSCAARDSEREYDIRDLVDSEPNGASFTLLPPGRPSSFLALR